MQGGDNIYSAVQPMDPTPADIAQWVWTSVGSGAGRVIFWLSSVANRTARVIAERDGESLATDRRLDSGGRVLWLPALVGQGAWFGDAAPLATLLKEAMPPTPPFPLVSRNGDCLVRALSNGDSYLSVVTNGAGRSTICSVQPPNGLKPASLWGDAPRRAEGIAHFDLAPLGTSVVLWSH